MSVSELRRSSVFASTNMPQRHSVYFDGHLSEIRVTLIQTLEKERKGQRSSLAAETELCHPAWCAVVGMMQFPIRSSMLGSSTMLLPARREFQDLA